MHSPAKDCVSTDTEDNDGTGSVQTQSAVESSCSQEDVDSLIENLQGQADNISYEIEKIVGVHRDDESGKSLYQVRWVAYTWIPEECLGSFHHLIKDYLADNPDKDNKYQTETDNVIENAGSSKSDCPDKQGTDIDNDDCDEGDIVDSDALDGNVLDKVATEASIQLACDVKKERFSLENGGETFPLPTASMVTIDETSDNVSTTPLRQSAMYCPKCQQRFYLKSNLEVHVLFCKGPIVLPDSIENIEASEEEVNSTLQTAANRLSVFSEDQTFEYVPLDSDFTDCTTCTQRLSDGAMLGDSLTDLAQLVAHSRKRSNDDDIEIYECDECDREFLYKHPMKKPAYLKTEGSMEKNKKRKIKSEKPFCCSICNRGFEKEADRLVHEEKHSNTPSRYCCASCGLKFITRNMLQEHYNSVSDCQPTKCDVCGRTFVHSSHLKRHLSIHAGVKPFICSICGHLFNQRSDLQRHERKHILNGKYTCLKCTMDFTDMELLKEHVSSHKHDENSKQTFSCEQCNKHFGRKSHYKRHLTIHEGIKPYGCDKCGKCFNQRTDLKRHLLSHLRREIKDLSTSPGVKKNENNFVCVVCNKVFTSHAAFLEHDVVHQKIMSTGVLY